ncbi:asparagine synthase (glutamine-hydrolyzing) [Ghiorsea bivora]|uniref:asparagine synthase (glutamine-hydrolyzing) n=1 Tax=Ghiorsea bivora TaxID=1485545 RepID=UPI000570C75D|nr:asparagine synthase (glutamine-hydrolyzing) [Ghiorsea bivora]
MCGFVSILGKTDAVELKAMAAAVAARGPDGQGEFMSSDFSAIHHRLAIIGPDARGNQPMQIDDVVVVFNGCIYNYKVLREKLEADGVTFQSDSDTEVIPHLYRRFGLGVFNLLEGMFSIVLWDKREQICLVARDVFGEKPLFVCEQDGRLGFASSQNAFEKGKWSLTPNLNSVYQILTRMRAEAPQSMYEEVSQIPAGCYAIARAGQPLQIRRYFFLPEPDQPQDLTADEIKPEVKSMLVQSITAKTVSDKPLGVFLSGGVDSSLIAGVLKQDAGQDVHSFCVRFMDAPKDYDESVYAQQVADHLGTTHQTLEVNATAHQALDDLASAFDMPVTNSAALPTYLISREAKKHVDVALSGVGGDELFGGYPRYLGLKWHEKLQGLPARSMALKLLESLGDSASSRNLRGRLRRFLKGLNDNPADAYRRWTSTTDAAWSDMFVGMQLSQPKHAWQNMSQISSGLQGLMQQYGVVNGAMIDDVIHYVGDDLLAVGDRMSMANGLELRAPLLDAGLFSFMATLDDSWKVEGLPWQEKLKVLLKEITCDYLPREMVYRPKQGFMAPIKHWMKADFKDDIHAMIADKPLGGLVRESFVQEQWDRHQKGEDKSDILWGLLLMNRWMQQHGWRF